jgi:hypothetical protein
MKFVFSNRHVWSEIKITANTHKAIVSFLARALECSHVVFMVVTDGCR